MANQISPSFIRKPPTREQPVKIRPNPPIFIDIKYQSQKIHPKKLNHHYQITL
jgi:hypothetical protein